MTADMRSLTVLFLVLLVPMAAAHSGEDEHFNETEELIESDTPCSELTEDQRVQIGDYYMEQMHSGEMHEVMDERMGGEGSESLRDAHLHMADRFYCGTSSSETMDADTADGWDQMPMMGSWGHTSPFMNMGWTGFLLQVALLVLAALGIIYLYQSITEQGEVDGGDSQ